MSTQRWESQNIAPAVEFIRGDSAVLRARDSHMPNAGQSHIIHKNADNPFETGYGFGIDLGLQTLSFRTAGFEQSGNFASNNAMSLHMTLVRRLWQEDAASIVADRRTIWTLNGFLSVVWAVLDLCVIRAVFASIIQDNSVNWEAWWRRP